jgi:hypothetical protein
MASAMGRSGFLCDDDNANQDEALIRVLSSNVAPEKFRSWAAGA